MARGAFSEPPAAPDREPLRAEGSSATDPVDDPVEAG
jgi:hypothetical protein